MAIKIVHNVAFSPSLRLNKSLVVHSMSVYKLAVRPGLPYDKCRNEQ